MSGYFTRLAERSGLRLGGAPHAGSHAMPQLPPPHPERPGPQPLEVEETRMVGGDALHADDLRNANPERGSIDGARRQGGEPGVRRIEVDPPHDSAAPFASARGESPQPELRDRPEPKSSATAIDFVRSMPDGSQGETAGYSPLPARDAAADRASASRPAPVGAADAASLEEMVVRMIESDPAGGPRADPPAGSADASPRMNSGTRQLLRDVIDWIAEPAEQHAGADPQPMEREAYREIAPGHAERAAGMRAGAPREEAVRDAVRSLASERGDAGRSDARRDDARRDDARRDDARRDDARREPIAHERAGREAQETVPLESSSPNFTLSIGSIRIVIEEPAPVQPAQMQASRGGGHARETKRTEESRLSRYYL
ncbi:MAG: hypothetical protein JST22_09830 [Bacteroidetes bacterium]|nr:hypothetical protein [Bacteroidota bacterium]